MISQLLKIVPKLWEALILDKTVVRLSDIGILSFNGNKIITTSGGGAFSCKNLRIKKQSCVFSPHRPVTMRHIMNIPPLVIIIE